MILEDLQKAIVLMGDSWQKQNNLLDRKTKFVYDVDNFELLDKMCKTMLKNEDNRKYAYHRQVNLNISNYCEELFCKYGGEKVENKKDKEKDIFIDDVPFDVKVTNYPSTAYESFDLGTAQGKKYLCIWLYNNQSSEGRQHFKNRLFVVCCGNNMEEMLEIGVYVPSYQRYDEKERIYEHIHQLKQSDLKKHYQQQWQRLKLENQLQ